MEKIRELIGLLAIGMVLLVACDSAQKSGSSTKKEHFDTSKKQVDDTVAKLDSTIRSAQKELSEETPALRKAGKHPISLQWIGWDKPGTAQLTPIDGEWYAIQGSQQGKEGDYLKIEGKIRRTGPKELMFEGKIETRVAYNNHGEVCVKTGKQIFYGKGDRKYYRLQNMENCEGGRLVDYVDIYPGTSDL